MIEKLTLPVTLTAGGTALRLRRATPDDLPDIVRVLADDAVSVARGDGARPEDTADYATALQRIVASPGNELVLAVSDAGLVVGTLQLTVIPCMSRRGTTRLLVETVHVLSAQRSTGIGSALMRWVIDQAAVELGTPLVQLTSDATREDAHRFYRRLGFTDSHLGFKYVVPQA